MSVALKEAQTPGFHCTAKKKRNHETRRPIAKPQSFEIDTAPKDIREFHSNPQTRCLGLCWWRARRRRVRVPMVWCCVGTLGLLELDGRLLARRRLGAKVAIVLRVCGVLGRRLVVGVMRIVWLVGRWRAWRWCHPCGSGERLHAALATATGIETAGFERCELGSSMFEMGKLTRKRGRAGKLRRRSRQRQPSDPSDPSWNRSIYRRLHRIRNSY